MSGARERRLQLGERRRGVARLPVGTGEQATRLCLHARGAREALFTQELENGPQRSRCVVRTKSVELEACRGEAVLDALLGEVALLAVTEELRHHALEPPRPAPLEALGDALVQRAPPPPREAGV